MYIQSITQSESNIALPDGTVLATHHITTVVITDGFAVFQIPFIDTTKKKADRRYNMLAALAELDGDGQEFNNNNLTGI